MRSKALRRPGAILPVLLALGACTMGPDYQRPGVPVPPRWKEATPRDQVLRGDWWEEFRDPPLGDLVRKALGANQTIAQAVGRVAEAEATLRITAAAQFPFLTADPSAVRQKLFTGITSDSTATRSLFQLPLNLSYEVDLWGRVRRSVEASRAAYQATVADLEVVRLGVGAEVAQTWFMLRHVDLDRQLLRETVDLRQQTQDLVEVRFRNGVANQLEVAQARIELAQAQSDSAALDRSRALLEHALAQLTGEPAPDVSFPDRRLDVAIPSLPVLLPSELLERRPDVAEAERRMMAANAGIGIAKAAYFPTVNLAALLGAESTDIRHLFRRSNSIWSLGGSASAPLFQGGAIDATVDVARAQYDEAVAAYRQSVLVAFQEVEDALSSLSVLERQAAAQDQALKAAQQAVTLARRRYEEGLASLIDLLDTQRSLLQAQRGASLIYRDRLLASVLLLRALGGGWNPNPAQEGAPR
jgi:multidrug efflux system outer membrane protein